MWLVTTVALMLTGFWFWNFDNRSSVLELIPLTEEVKVFPPIAVLVSQDLRLGPSIHNMLLKQSIADSKNTMSFPLERFDGEFPVLFRNKREVLLVTDRIAKQEMATIFNTSNPNLVIKYQCDCFKSGQVHPLIRDYGFLERLNATNVGPRVFFLSPATLLGPKRTTKTDFAIDESEREDCFRFSRPTLRYMVMERLEKSLFNVEQLPLLETARIIKSSVNLETRSGYPKN
jgi:hypothetical protein